MFRSKRWVRRFELAEIIGCPNPKSGRGGVKGQRAAKTGNAGLIVAVGFTVAALGNIRRENENVIAEIIGIGKVEGGGTVGGGEVVFNPGSINDVYEPPPLA